MSLSGGADNPLGGSPDLHFLGAGRVLLGEYSLLLGGAPPRRSPGKGSELNALEDRESEVVVFIAFEESLAVSLLLGIKDGKRQYPLVVEGGGRAKGGTRRGGLM